MPLSRLLAILFFAACGVVARAQAGYVQIITYPHAIVANGISTLTVTATVGASSNGASVPDGTQVLFTTDLGTFRSDIVGTKNGIAQAILVAGTITGTATIKAKVLGFPIAPQTATVQFVDSSALLSSANEFVEITSPTYLKYSPQDKVIVAEGAGQTVSIRYRDIKIVADVAELNINAYNVHAQRAVMTVGKVTRAYQELDYTLNTHSGFGVTNFTSQEIDGIKGWGKAFEFETHPVDITGYVDIAGNSVTKSPTPYVASYFQIGNLDDETQPALISARQATVFPGKEVQFKRAELYLGDSKVMRMPLFKSPLNGSSPIFTDQFVNVNDNQLAASYPYYLTLKPGLTSLVRLHIGDHESSFGNGNGPQMDYEMDWNRGDQMEGGLLVGGLGLRDWGVSLHQSYQLDSRTNAMAQLQMPGLRSINGYANYTKQFARYSTALTGTITDTIVGIPEVDENLSFNTQTNPVHIGKLPLSYSLGLTAVHQSTSLPVAIQSQDGYGLQSRLTLDPKRLDRSTTLTASAAASQLEGRNVTKGISLSAQLALSHQLTREASLFVTYNFTQDSFSAAVLGEQQLTAQFSYQKGNAFLSMNGSRSLGVDHSDYSVDASYRIAPLWRVGYSYMFDRFVGANYLDFAPVLYYRLGQREVGLVWSHAARRFGIQVLGASIY